MGHIYMLIGYIAETCAHGQSVPLNPAKPKIQDRDFHLSDVNARWLTVHNHTLFLKNEAGISSRLVSRTNG